jgi:hypothetical protein
MTFFLRTGLLIVLAACAAVPAGAGQLAPDVTVADGHPTGALSVSVFTAPYWGADSRAAVLIGAEIDGFKAHEAQPDAVEVRFAVIARRPEAAGSPSGSDSVASETVTVSLGDASTRKQAVDEGIRVLTRAMLPSGRYQLRVEAISGGVSGNALHELDVPGFVEPSPIAMSGIVMTSSHADRFTHTHAELEHDNRLLPILAQPPSARRAFSRTERLEVHAEFYERQVDVITDQQIDVVTRVLTADGRLVWETSDIGQSETLSGGRFGYAHSALVPIGTLRPGRYILQVAAETQYGVPASVSRSVPFTILGTD